MSSMNFGKIPSQPAILHIGQCVFNHKRICTALYFMLVFTFSIIVAAVAAAAIGHIAVAVCFVFDFLVSQIAY